MFNLSPGYIRDKGLVRKFNKRNKTNNSIHPSALYECSRKIYYDMTKDPPSPKITKKFKQLLRNGSDGIGAHEQIIKDLGPIVIEEDMKLTYQDRCNGRIDAIIKYGEIKAVLEIKTVKDYRFRQIRKLNKPELKMSMQLVYYMWRLQLPGWLYIENKNTQEYIEFYYPTWEIPLLDKIKDKITLINSHLDDESLPPRERDKNSSDCKWCNWNKECWK